MAVTSIEGVPMGYRLRYHLGAKACLSAGAGLLLAGCATVYEGKYGWRDGWREGEVVRVQTASEMDRPRFYRCVRQATAEQLTSTRFVEVKYRQMSRANFSAVPLGAGQSVRPGDLVYVKVGDCKTPVVPRRTVSTQESANA